MTRLPTSVGLFAGIGGIEEGLRRAGWITELLCELDPVARAVLETQFPEAKHRADICDLRGLPSVDLIAAGFPCQDLSQAGQTDGIHGRQSSLVKQVFRLVESARKPPKWILLENVPFMLRLDQGRAMRYVARRLGMLGYTWAYRVVDTRAFGLPQRRKRVLILASRTEDPRGVLLSTDQGQPPQTRDKGRSYGFYWTEGNTGLGWAKEAIPALKTGSRISIPSPPAVWVPDERFIGIPDIRDAERLQGFPINWTKPAVRKKIDRLERHRWRLVGNAVSVPVATWIGRRILKPAVYKNAEKDDQVSWDSSWGIAGWGRKGERYSVRVSDWPVDWLYQALSEFLSFDLSPLSVRATTGFLERARASTLNVRKLFLADLAYHARQMNRKTVGI